MATEFIQLDANNHIRKEDVRSVSMAGSQLSARIRFIEDDGTVRSYNKIIGEPYDSGFLDLIGQGT